MSKVGGATAAKKKKGRPSLLDLKNRALKKEELQNQQKIQRISTHRNPNSTSTVSGYDVSADEDEYYEDEDDDERSEKKIQLVVRLPQSNQLQQQASSDLIRSSSGKKISKVIQNLHGSPLQPGPTTPLPDKNLLDFILERLQKKDTYGVFSEPVAPNELPDYHETIKHPMDFGTVKSKLNKGVYSSLDELEADVLLICSNAMQYNSSDTIYFRQARSIQELAKRDFGNLRQEGEDGELQPKVVKRGRPPSKRPPGRPPLDPVGPESTSGATLATPEDNTNDSTPYNLRRVPNREQQPYSELLSEWNEEFPVKIRRADMKYGNIKDFIIDETRRDTYNNYKQYLVANFGGEKKRLMAVGDGYGRSLACFAANLGPVVWKIASKKIDKAIPSGYSESTTVNAQGTNNSRVRG